MKIRTVTIAAAALVWAGAAGALAADFTAEREGEIRRMAEKAREGSADIPACLQPVLNQVDVCYETIVQQIQGAQRDLDKKNGPGAATLGTPMAFPTQDPPGTQAILVVVPLSKPGAEPVALFEIFQADIGYGLMWKKQCTLKGPTKHFIVPLKEKRETLRRIFGCD